MENLAPIIMQMYNMILIKLERYPNGKIKSMKTYYKGTDILCSFYGAPALIEFYESGNLKKEVWYDYYYGIHRYDDLPAIIKYIDYTNSYPIYKIWYLFGVKYREENKPNYVWYIYNTDSKSIFIK